VNRVDRPDRNQSVQSLRNGHSGDDVDIQQPFLNQNIADAVIVVRPSELEHISEFVARRELGRQRIAGLRLAPVAPSFCVLLLPEARVDEDRGRREAETNGPSRLTPRKIAIIFYLIDSPAALEM